jgi:tetratricopeptide (TPR) repeat protein
MKKATKTTIDLDIRFFRRYPKEIDFIVHIKKEPFSVKTVDYSFSGLGIVIEDSPPIRAGDFLFLDIEELNIHQKGRVLWTMAFHSALRVGIAKIGPLKGSLRHYRLSDILIGLQRTLKTGILDIRQDSINKKVYIKNGNMIFATSNQDKDRLGDMLLKRRKISKEQYAKAAERKKKTGERYAAILVDLGFLKPAELLSAVELHVKRIIGSLFVLKDAEFEFKEGSFPAKDAVTLKLSVANLIYREVKKTADVELLKEYLLDSVVDFSPDPLNLFQDIRLNKMDREIFSLVDGKISMNDIIRLSPCKQEDSLKSIYALLEARILEIKKEGDPPHGITHEEIFEKTKETPHELRDKIENMYSKYQNLGYYGVLGIKEWATDEEIKKAYYKAAKEFHPDVHFSLPKDMKEKLIEIFTYITNAYLILTDSLKRKEYDSNLQQAQAADAKNGDATREFSIFEQNIVRNEYSRSPHLNHTRVVKNSKIAQARFLEGKAEFKKENFENAAHLFATAIYFDRSVSRYHYFYGCALGMIDKLKEAVEVLNTALELDKPNPDIVAELGHVYLKLGFPLRAKGYFNKALELNPFHVRAKEGFRIIKKSKAREH